VSFDPLPFSRVYMDAKMFSYKIISKPKPMPIVVFIKFLKLTKQFYLKVNNKFW